MIGHIIKEIYRDLYILSFNILNKLLLNFLLKKSENLLNTLRLLDTTHLYAKSHQRTKNIIFLNIFASIFLIF